MGRFTQADPYFHVMHGNMQSSTLYILQSANLFLFTMHNPVRWQDPTGLFAQDAHFMDCPNSGGNRGEYLILIFIQQNDSSGSRSINAHFLLPVGLMIVASSTIYGIINSVSLEIEYGAGIGKDVRFGVLQGRVDPAVARNTMRICMQGITHGDWAFHTGAFLGLTPVDIELGGYARFHGDSSLDEWFVGANLPGNAMIGWGNQTGTEMAVSVGGSMYFGLGGGVQLQFSFTEFRMHFMNAVQRWWD